MSEEKRKMFAGKRARIRHTITTQDRPDGYVLLKLNHILPALLRAERKVVEGTYGICDTCGERIGKKRLKAAPGAIRCIGCQEDFERQLIS